jgi:hypothetical protein
MKQCDHRRSSNHICLNRVLYKIGTRPLEAALSTKSSLLTRSAPTVIGDFGRTTTPVGEGALRISPPSCVDRIVPTAFWKEDTDRDKNSDGFTHQTIFSSLRVLAT